MAQEETKESMISETIWNNKKILIYCLFAQRAVAVYTTSHYLSVSSSFLCLRRAAACYCGTRCPFLLHFFIVDATLSLCIDVYVTLYKSHVGVHYISVFKALQIAHYLL